MLGTKVRDNFDETPSKREEMIVLMLSEKIFSMQPVCFVVTLID